MISEDSKLFGTPRSVRTFSSSDGKAVIRQYEVPANDPGESTANRAKLLMQPSCVGCYYILPRHTVSANDASVEFVRRCWQIRVEWNMSVQRMLGGSANRRRAYAQSTALERIWLFHGVLIIDGRYEYSASDWLARHCPELQAGRRPGAKNESPASATSRGQETGESQINKMDRTFSAS